MAKRVVESKVGDLGLASAPSPAAVGPSINPLASFAIADFRWLWSSGFIGFMAMQMKQVVQGWLVYDISHSPLALGLVITALGIPMVVMAPIGGVLADRVPKKALIAVTQSGNALLVLIVGILVSLHLIEVWHVFVIGIMNGTLISLNGPARQAMLPEVVDRGRLTNAIGLSTSGINVARILGPALAGVLIAAIGMAGALYVVTGLYLLSVCCLVPIRGLRPGALNGAKKKFTADAMEGFKYVYRSSLLLTIVSMSFVAILLGWPYQSLMPAFVAEALDAGPEALGLLLSVTGAGALVGSLLTAMLGRFPRKGALLLVSMLVYSIALVMFTFSRDMVTASATLFLLGLVSAIFMVLATSLLQLLTPAGMYGRVMSINMMTFGLQPLAVLPLGAVAEHIGTPQALAIAAGLMVVVSALYLAMAVGLRRLRAENEVPR